MFYHLAPCENKGHTTFHCHAESKLWFKVNGCGNTFPYISSVDLQREIFFNYISYKEIINIFHESQLLLTSQLLATETLGIHYIELIWKGLYGCNPGRKASNKFCRKPDLNKNKVFIFLIQERVFFSSCVNVKSKTNMSLHTQARQSGALEFAAVICNGCTLRSDNEQRCDLYVLHRPTPHSKEHIKCNH